MNDGVSQSIQLSIILPAYKEKENLAIFIPQIEEELRAVPHEIIVVDDNSKDGTRELLETFQLTSPHVHLLERAGLLGIGSALRDGYNQAKGEFILSSDADLSFSPQDMRRLFQKIQEGFDLVLGYRVPPPTDSTHKHSLKGWMENSVISPFSNWTIGLISGMGLKNYNTDFRIIRSSLWKRIRTVENRQFFLFETIFRSKNAGARMAEIPVIFSPRKFGESKVSFFKQAWAYFLKLVQMVFFDRTA
jgi:glycosyltransferase involved in cell wall biosynthesis